MSGKRVKCTGCSLLCDDIIIKSNGLYIDEVYGACLKGKERFDQITSKNRILSPLIRKNGDLVKIASNSSICQGKVLNTSKQTGMTLTTISEVINKTDLLIFWGANVAESIPRLLNKALFSRGKFRMTGREIKTIIIIDPVKTASFGVMGVRDIALQINPGKDLELIRALKEECCVWFYQPP